MRIVLDTNIIISAALRGGFSEDILTTLVVTQTITLIISEGILEELAQKLESKFSWSKTEVNFFTDYIRQVSQLVKVKEKLEIIKRDPEDNKILECAVAGKADLIVSSDQDLINLKEFLGIGIVHPKTLTWIFPEYFRKLKR